MKRIASVAAYQKIKDNGLLSTRRFQVYEHIYQNGPVTQRQTCAAFGHHMSNSIRPRFAELERAGVVKVVGEVVDSKTDMTVSLWDVTDRLPTKIVAPMGKKDRKIAELEERVAFYKSVARKYKKKYVELQPE